MAPRVRVALMAAVLSLGSSGCAQLGLGAPSYDEELSILETVDDIPAQQVSLSDGSQLVVGYVGDGEYAAQWRAPEGDGWTAPETLVEDDELEPSLIGVADEGATAVVRFSWYPEGDEREEYARVDAAVCRDASCELQEGGGTPVLAEGGEYAVAVRPADTLDVDPTGPAPAYEVATWPAGGWWQGWDEKTVDGPSRNDLSAFERPSLVLTDDGRLATVRAVEDGGCTYELWVGEPRSTELLAAATVVVGEDDCVVRDVTAEGNAVAFTAQSTDDTLTFERTDDGWSMG